MKPMKTFFAIVILVALSATLMAGNDRDRDLRVGGIRAGYQGSGLFLGNGMYPASETYPSFYAGFFRDTRIFSVLHFGSGAEYFQNGLQFTPDNRRVLHYISLPLDLKLKLGPIFALGGMAPSFKVAEREFINGYGEKPPSGDRSRGFDAPVFVGAGLKIWFLTLEARYHWGLLDVYDGYYNRYLQIGAGISF